MHAQIEPAQRLQPWTLTAGLIRKQWRCAKTVWQCTKLRAYLLHAKSQNCNSRTRKDWCWLWMTSTGSSKKSQNLGECVHFCMKMYNITHMWPFRLLPFWPSWKFGEKKPLVCTQPIESYWLCLYSSCPWWAWRRRGSLCCMSVSLNEHGGGPLGLNSI